MLATLEWLPIKGFTTDLLFDGTVIEYEDGKEVRRTLPDGKEIIANV